MESGARLAIALLRPGTVHWGVDGWRGATNAVAVDTGLGLHIADLDVSTLNHGQRVNFTFRSDETGEWVGRDFFVDVNQHAQAIQSESNSPLEEQRAPNRLVGKVEDAAS